MGGRGLGPKNDVLTICKAVTLRFGQRIIEVSFPLLIFLDFLEEENRQSKSEMLKKLKKITSCIFVFLAYRICLFGTEIAGETKTQPCYILTNNNAFNRFTGFNSFLPGKDNLMLIKIY